jgi:hypothetical protein
MTDAPPLKMEGHFNMKRLTIKNGEAFSAVKRLAIKNGRAFQP